MKSTAIDISNLLKKKLLGKKISINGISSLDKLKTNSLIFLEKDRVNNNFINKLNKTKNLLFITNSKHKILKSYSYIYTKNPRLDYNKIIKQFYKFKIVKKKIHPSVEIGLNTVIYDNVIIKKNVKIGNNVTIYEGTKINENSIINDGCVIGTNGFAPTHDNKKKLSTTLTSTGGTSIGKNVIVGPLTNIDKGTIDDTIILDNVHIDSMVMIGHNCKVEKNTIITTGVVLCGGSKIMSNCWIGANSTIKERVKINKNNLIGISSVVLKDTKSDGIYAGNPVKYLRKNLRK
jgi:UDP-3-O-[3-hydroxymyristoyl] glucosamine N-acyltransferase